MTLYGKDGSRWYMDDGGGRVILISGPNATLAAKLKRIRRKTHSKLDEVQS